MGRRGRERERRGGGGGGEQFVDAALELGDAREQRVDAFVVARGVGGAGERFAGVLEDADAGEERGEVDRGGGGAGGARRAGGALGAGGPLRARRAGDGFAVLQAAEVSVTVSSSSRRALTWLRSTFCVLRICSKSA